MNNTGDAAEQIVRLSLEGTEVALRLTGSAAKNVAAALYAMAKNRDKTKVRGRQRLTAMLKSGKELKVFTIGDEHLKQFALEAKRYGVVYCALRGKERSADGLVDIMVRAEDASKINRIVERFHLATVDTVAVRHDIEQRRARQNAAHEAGATAQEDQLLDELLGPASREKAENPAQATRSKSHPSEPISGTQRKTAEGTTKTRPSVREELREIKAARQEQADAPKQQDVKAPAKQTQPPVQHHHNPGKKKPKQKAR